ncbi:MAG TPA: PPC domain-containing DNA-binding protein [Ramlibacter sp.]|uniref:PPC domain-containing DNA-binding protein n=1 Tax=Ramlibacter sp. TaxID=1917967 RepID=UPI002BBA6AF6|nr:PPC domain-containing DNA-binding protein [Ramlibacter sp.]HVZ46919.1 PPC domain-containing DNA-binding protein [Ramlibacter sp.]
MTSAIDWHVVRLEPGEDLRASLQAFFDGEGMSAAFIASAIGSLEQATLRFAGEPRGTRIDGPLELVSLAGTLSLDGVHLHASVSDARGAMRGGHVMPECIVRTTAEIVVAQLRGWEFRRELDERTGFRELLATKG